MCETSVKRDVHQNADTIRIIIANKNSKTYSLWNGCILSGNIKAVEHSKKVGSCSLTMITSTIIQGQYSVLITLYGESNHVQCWELETDMPGELCETLKEEVSYYIK